MSCYQCEKWHDEIVERKRKVAHISRLKLATVGRSAADASVPISELHRQITDRQQLLADHICGQG
jgi:hypothetical protein